jgi:hypothetical protein
MPLACEEPTVDAVARLILCLSDAPDILDDLADKEREPENKDGGE